MRIKGLELAGRTVLAPMAGITDPPFRKIVQRFGVSALWTEMMSSHALAVVGKTFRTMDLDGHEVPTVFQICGYDPGIMAEAARIVQDKGAAAVDLNMGCPVKKIVKKGAGAALMKNLPLAGRILSAVRGVIDVALTVKIRAGWDASEPNAAALARVIENEGADAVVVHARTRSQLHSGPASLDIVAEVKEAVRIPVIGNGGIHTVEDAETMMELTGCDGVMVGRGALGRPWLPGKILGRQRGEPSGVFDNVTVFDVIRQHYDYELQVMGIISAVRRMRKHLVWYSRELAGGAHFRESVLRLEDPAQVLARAREFFGQVVIS